MKIFNVKWIVFSHQNIIVWFYILQCIIKHLNRKCSTFIKSYIFIRYQNNLTYFVFDLCSALSVVDVETCLKRIIIEHYRKITPYSIVIFPKLSPFFYSFVLVNNIESFVYVISSSISHAMTVGLNTSFISISLYIFVEWRVQWPHSYILIIKSFQ